MGVVNVTPDSFSDGGRYLDHAAAITHGRALAARGRGHRRRGRRVDPARAPIRCRWATSWAGCVPVVEALVAAGVAGVDRHPQGRGGRGRGARRRLPGQRRVGLACRGSGSDRRGVRGHAHAGRPAARCSASRPTATSWPRCATSWSSGPRPRWPPGSRPARCGSTRASGSASASSTTWPCWPTSTSWWRPGSRCWWAPAARACWERWRPAPIVSSVRRRPTIGSRGRWPPRRGRLAAAPPWCASTRWSRQCGWSKRCGLWRRCRMIWREATPWHR